MSSGGVSANPHLTTRTLTYGETLENASAAMILLHGRGSSPEDIIRLSSEVDPGGDVIYLAPAAAGAIWWPQTFLAPQASNQPLLSFALERVRTLLDEVGTAGIPPERVILLGFSQGACLAVEYAARNTRCYGGVAALSGGLVGDNKDLTGYTGSLEGTPVLLGCSDIDPYIPLERVRRSHNILRELGAEVDERIYPNMGHHVNRDEIEAVASMVQHLADSAAS